MSWKNYGSLTHVRLRSRESTGILFPILKLGGNVEVRQVRMPFFIQKNIVGFDIPTKLKKKHNNLLF